MNWIAESKQRRHKKQAVQAIDVLLADKPDAFRATVFELSRQLGWADDEPSFLLAIATNQLEALVKQYPERISKAMEEASAELVADWKKLQAELSLTAVQATNIALQIDQRLFSAKQLIDDKLEQVEQLLTREQRAMLSALSTERTAMLDAISQEQAAMLAVMANERAAVVEILAGEREATAALSQQLSEQLRQESKTQTDEIIAQGVVTSWHQVEEQVNRIVSGVRGKHFWETVAVALIAAVVLLTVGLMAGLLLARQPQSSFGLGVIESQTVEE